MKQRDLKVKIKKKILFRFQEFKFRRDENRNEEINI